MESRRPPPWRLLGLLDDALAVARDLGSPYLCGVIAAAMIGIDEPDVSTHPAEAKAAEQALEDLLDPDLQQALALEAIAEAESVFADFPKPQHLKSR